MKVEQTSEHIKASNSTIQRLVNAIVGAMKINSQEIARPSVVPSSMHKPNETKWPQISKALQVFEGFRDNDSKSVFQRYLETIYRNLIVI
jgi:hypothetical protein